jgi:hypothetical protein
MKAIYRAGATLLLAFMLAGCAQGDGNGSSPSAAPSANSGLGAADGSSPASGGGSPASGGTGGTGSGTLSSPAAAIYPSSAGPYTQAALSAWANGDTARLGQLRDPGATIFATLSAGNYDKHFALRSCQGAAGSSYCTFYNNVGDELVLRVSNEKLSHPHAVMDGSFHPITFPTDMQAYAQECLDAWKAGNTARVSYLTTSDALTHLNAIPGAYRSTSWTFAGAQGAAGSSYLTWQDPAGDRLMFRFHNPGVVPGEGPQHRIVDVLWNP